MGWDGWGGGFGASDHSNIQLGLPPRVPELICSIVIIIIMIIIIIVLFIVITDMVESVCWGGGSKNKGSFHILKCETEEPPLFNLGAPPFYLHEIFYFKIYFLV